MSNQSKLDLLRKQLEEAKAAESAAMGDFLRYGTPHYAKTWAQATEESQRLAEELLREETLFEKIRNLLEEMRKQRPPAS